MNLKREREARTWKIKQTIFYCMYSILAWAWREREMRIYDIWPWNASVKPITTCSDFSCSCTAFTGEEQNKKTSFYARGNRETNWIHHKCPVQSCMNSLLNSTEKHTLKTGVAEYSWPIQHFWVHLKSFNFSCKTMLISVRVVFASMLMTVLL